MTGGWRRSASLVNTKNCSNASGIDYKRVKDAYPEVHHIRSFFGSDDFHSRDLPNEQALDWDGPARAPAQQFFSLRPKTIETTPR